MASKAPDQTFTPAERIRQLNDIDQDVAQLLRSAGLAIQALTNGPSTDEPSQPEASSASDQLESHKRAFKNSSSQYFALLSSIDVKLRRQVYALEEASIIRPESNTSLKSAEGPSAAAASTSSGPGGSNPLEISWLNSRKDTVGKDKEAELWAEARKFVTQLQTTSQDNTSADGAPAPPAGDDGKEGMEID